MGLRREQGEDYRWEDLTSCKAMSTFLFRKIGQCCATQQIFLFEGLDTEPSKAMVWIAGMFPGFVVIILLLRPRSASSTTVLSLSAYS